MLQDKPQLATPGALNYTISVVRSQPEKIAWRLACSGSYCKGSNAVSWPGNSLTTGSDLGRGGKGALLAYFEQAIPHHRMALITVTAHCRPAFV